jgi:hypothetical protein
MMWCLAGTPPADTVGRQPFDPTRVRLCVAGFLFLLLVAGRLGTRGKTSESWAFLAITSWMVMPAAGCLYILQLAPDLGAKNFVYGAVGLLAVLLLSWGSIRSALRDRWGEVMLWWLSTFAAVIALTTVITLFVTMLGMH